ncbi:GNAT family N-acetyltransferase [Streptomyces sp. NPDC007861]|uniref:GNAT family N-acetyltransferase n=1 Tax=Streptomyces sp. NPDC007861 TaxID=3154893 RepID=UPI0033DD127D
MGEVFALYVRPDLTGQGIGRALLDEAHRCLEDLHFRVSTLWVLRGNEGARRFYERMGYRADGGVQGDDYDGVTLTELRYRRTPHQRRTQ